MRPPTAVPSTELDQGKVLDVHGPYALVSGIRAASLGEEVDITGAGRAVVRALLARGTWLACLEQTPRVHACVTRLARPWSVQLPEAPLGHVMGPLGVEQTGVVAALQASLPREGTGNGRSLHLGEPLFDLFAPVSQAHCTFAMSPHRVRSDAFVFHLLRQCEEAQIAVVYVALGRAPVAGPGPLRVTVADPTQVEAGPRATAAALTGAALARRLVAEGRHVVLLIDDAQLCVERGGHVASLAAANTVRGLIEHARAYHSPSASCTVIAVSTQAARGESAVAAGWAHADRIIRLHETQGAWPLLHRVAAETSRSAYIAGIRDVGGDRPYYGRLAHRALLLSRSRRLVAASRGAHGSAWPAMEFEMRVGEKLLAWLVAPGRLRSPVEQFLAVVAIVESIAADIRPEAVQDVERVVHFIMQSAPELVEKLRVHKRFHHDADVATVRQVLRALQ